MTLDMSKQRTEIMAIKVELRAIKRRIAALSLKKHEGQSGLAHMHKKDASNDIDETISSLDGLLYDFRDWPYVTGD